MLPIRQILQEMAAEKLRLSLTILAVAWSTLCIAGLLAVGEGIRSGIVRTIQNGNGNLIHISGGFATLTHGSFHEGQTLKLTEQDSQVLATLPAVKRALLLLNGRSKSPLKINAHGCCPTPLLMVIKR